jgi:hypothetical protein
MPSPDQFIHRYLEPYHESFCALCARQVGMVKEESDLVQEERNHICDPYSVEMFRKYGTDPAKFLRRLHNIPN